MPTTGEISLYFHIPFCTRKCPYCHFYVAPDKPDLKALLLEGLRREWELYRPLAKGKTVVSTYFGGGTPALFGSEAIGEILSWLPKAREVTLEANPAEITLPLMKAYAASGINRVSIGVQSFHDPTLKILGRLHTAQDARRAIEETAAAGIGNITIDLMYETPSQTLESWQETLNELPSLPITHLSLYNLTVEPNTPFFRKKKQLTFPQPEIALAMLEAAVSSLEAMGLKRYEISAFARPGNESTHNIGYWTGRPFLGFGPSAFSYWEGKRYRNVADLKAYAIALEAGRFPVDFEEKLGPKASLHEQLAVALRLIKGVDIRRFPVESSLYETLQKLGWLEIEGFCARLSPKGLLFYDSVAQEVII